MIYLCLIILFFYHFNFVFSTFSLGTVHWLLHQGDQIVGPCHNSHAFIQMFLKLAIHLFPPATATTTTHPQTRPPPRSHPTHRSCHLTSACPPAVIGSDRWPPGKLTSHWEVILKVIAAETLWHGGVLWKGGRGGCRGGGRSVGREDGIWNKHGQYLEGA